MEAVDAAPDRQGFRYNEVTVIRALGLAVVLAWAVPARADDRPPAPAQSPELAAHLEKVRQLYAAGDFVHAREELLAAYALDPVPDLLFALGQVEFNLHHYREAIAYYERFTATNPSAEQVALAQQAIGAARMRMKQPPPAKPPPPRRLPPRQWYVSDTALLAVGGATALVGGGLLVQSQRLGSDQSGTLADYDHRLSTAHTMRWIGVGLAAGGAVLAGVVIVRWRLRPDGGEVAASVTPTGIGVSGRW